MTANAEFWRAPSVPRASATKTVIWLSAGAARGIRTPDPLITNEVLYQLSYCGAAIEPAGRSIGVAVYADFGRFGNMVSGFRIYGPRGFKREPMWAAPRRAR
jgi:hypothetical protein